MTGRDLAALRARGRGDHLTVVRGTRRGSVPLNPSPTLAREACDAAELKPCLSVVLAELGHACPGSCRAVADELGAQVWFSWRPPTRDGHRDNALVVIDTNEYAGSVFRANQLLHQINNCTQAHGIRVVERRFGDTGLALAASAPWPRELTWVRRDGRCPGCRRSTKNTNFEAEWS